MKNEEIIQVLGSYLNSLKTSRRRCVEQKSYTEFTEVVLVNLNREIQAVDEAVEILKRVPENEPLSLEQLRNMVGAPVWMEELKLDRAQWAILWSAGDTGMFYTTTERGTNYAAYSLYGVTWQAYGYHPFSLDRKLWQRCEDCDRCAGGGMFQPRGVCVECGRPLTEETWDALRRRIMGNAGKTAPEEESHGAK